MLTTHAAEFATVPLIASCSFVFRVVGFIIDDLKEKKIEIHKKHSRLRRFLGIKRTSEDGPLGKVYITFDKLWRHLASETQSGIDCESISSSVTSDSLRMP